MSRLGVFPIAVLMQQHRVSHPWADDCWQATAVLPAAGGDLALAPPQEPVLQQYLIDGLSLELYPDEDDGYFENWAAPEPRVWILWRMQEGRAQPALATVSYAEGARMLDSGESVDGVPMPPEVFAWLGDYLRLHYRPPQRRQRH